MGKSKLRRWKWAGANLCRLLLSVAFVFSGTVKLIDPRGTQYKIEDYAALWEVDRLLPQGIPLAMAVGLAMTEFYIGFNLFFGIRRRTTTRLALLLMVVMTPLTLWLAATDVHMDCGCFGDALVLTNWQTFGKNIVLLAAAIVTVMSYRRLTRLITERNQWMLSLYSLVFALGLALYNIHYLPVMDFRPYHIGTDLPQAIMDEWEGDGSEMRYADFSIQTTEGEDITFDWLGREGYKFLLVAPALDNADDSSMDKINALYDYSQEQGYAFLGLTASDTELIDRWKDLMGAEYDFCQADGTVLKTMIRSNPGLIMLRNGVIYQKWSCNDLPTVDTPTAPLDGQRMGQLQTPSRARAVYRLLMWFLIPLIVWTMTDRIWVGSKFYKRYRIHKENEKENNE